MKRIVAILIAAGMSFAAASSASAAGGCGPGLHRGPAGGCRPNRGAYVRPGRPVIGHYYGGRGYWDGRRYYQQRYRRGDGWRYR